MHLIPLSPAHPQPQALLLSAGTWLLVKCEPCLLLLGNRLEQEEPLQNPELYMLKILLIKFFLIFFPRKESGLFVRQIGNVSTIRVSGHYCVEMLPEFSAHHCDYEPPEIILSLRQDNGETLFLPFSEFVESPIFCP